jgi:membrane protein implicated in regulation of membrane protease activity
MFLICATAGGTVLVVQTILLALGVGAETDSDLDPGDLHDAGHAFGHDHSHEHGHADASDSFLKLISFKTLVAFVTFFGLTGLASQKGGLTTAPTLVLSVGAGVAALYIVAYLMSVLSRLQSRGNLDFKNAIGQSAKVYLRIPGQRSGQGKVTVSLQGRRVECKAITAGEEIPTGSEVQVVAASTAGVLEVLPAERS